MPINLIEVVKEQFKRISVVGRGTGGVTMDAFPVHLNGNKYDLKNFLHDHPGGVNTLKNFEGKSIKNAMERWNHSVRAYHMLNGLKTDDKVTGEVSGNGRIITSDDKLKNAEEIAFLEELESRVDWSKPIFWQLEAVAPHYETWVHSPVHMPCRLFHNPIAEAMTYTPWYLVPMFWIPIILYLGYTQYWDTVLCGDSCKYPRLSPVQFASYLAIGAFLLWTGIEYVFHRYIFHLNPGKSDLMIKFHFIIHGMHHKVPFDKYRQVFPPIPAAVIGYALYSFFKLVLPYPKVFLIGGLIGYLTYDMIHYYVHQGSPKDGSYLYEMKRYHTSHHFVNHDKAFGITNKAWDNIFRTIVSVRKLDFSLQW